MASHRTAEEAPPSIVCRQSNVLTAVANPRFVPCLDIMASHRTAEEPPPNIVCQQSNVLAAVANTRFVPCLDRLAHSNSGIPPSIHCQSNREIGSWFQRNIWTDSPWKQGTRQDETSPQPQHKFPAGAAE